MSTIFGKYEMSPEVQIRANELYEQHRRQIYVRTDQLFAALMILQWIACLMSAWWISPRSWAGPYSQTHIHVWAALILGGIITSLPVLMTVALPGSAITRHTVAVAQMLTSALIIHLMGGRIESALPRFWIAGIFSRLPRLARIDNGDGRGGSRSFAARHVLAGIGIRGAFHVLVPNV